MAGIKIAKLLKFGRAQPEVFWSTVGGLSGAIVGFSIGRVGIAAKGGASGIAPLVVVIIFAAVVGSIGNRLGIAIGRRQTRGHAVPPTFDLQTRVKLGASGSLTNDWF
ncbi:hypothetical protein ACVWWR_001201 [Bradyrhizobium sp. LM3.2]